MPHFSITQRKLESNHGRCLSRLLRFGFRSIVAHYPIRKGVSMIPIDIRACVHVSHVAATDTKPTRVRVKIRDFPTRFYSRWSAPDSIDDSRLIPQWFAECRVRELGLEWLPFKAAGHIPGFGEIFVAGGAE